VTLRFRSLERDDLATLAAWIAAPHVALWWRSPPGLDDVRATYEPIIDQTDPTEVFIFEADGIPIGMIQRYLLADYPEWAGVVAPMIAVEHASGIDYLIGSIAHLGRGIGSQMIAAFVDLTFKHCPDITSVVVAVNQDNRRSWRALEKSGFQRTWAGTLESDDPSDLGLSYVYVRDRTVPWQNPDHLIGAPPD
jgi:aminoglycoside 6'-N-acetyltransferase